MQYISTRDANSRPVSAAYAIRHGLARDGGLYVPVSFPAYEPAGWRPKNYSELARDIFSLYLTGFAAEDVRACVENAYGGNFPEEVAPCVTVGDVEVLELFRGPTAAFKDVALQALPHFLTLAMKECGDGKKPVILTATSGDTGKAALEGFKDVPGVKIIVFYPRDGVSEVQKRQMISTAGANVSVVSVDGNFDTCQSGVKALFGDEGLLGRMAEAGFDFSSANSINFGRLLPQIVYYYHGYCEMVEKGRIKAGEEIRVVVPSGNFGNILAAYYAKRMGLPIGCLVCASNVNDVLTEAITSGVYNRIRPFHATTSPSMDILVSSNFERFLFEMYGRDAAGCAADLRSLGDDGRFTIRASAREAWSEFMTADMAGESDVGETIKRVLDTYGYLLDPHTAVGWRVLERQGTKMPSLLAATASPYKFTEAVLAALGCEASGNRESERQELLARVSGTAVPPPLAGIEELPVLHKLHTTPEGMKAVIEGFLSL